MPSAILQCDKGSLRVTQSLQRVAIFSATAGNEGVENTTIRNQSSVAR